MGVVLPSFDPRRLPVYWREADARVVIDAWQASGMSVSAFAHRYSLNVERLRRWRRRLEAADAPAGPRFVQVVASRPVTTPLVLHVGDVRIDVPQDFDDETLARVLQVLSC